MFFCFLLSMVFVTAAIVLLFLGFMKRRQARAGRLNVKILGAQVSATGVMASCIGGAIVFGLMGYLTFSGCKPEETIKAISAVDTAKATFEEAEVAEAGKYASAELRSAEVSLAAARKLLKEQESGILLRDFDGVIKLAEEAKTKARLAKDAAANAKHAAKTGGEVEYAKAAGAVESAKEWLRVISTCSRKPKGFDADLEALKGRLDGLEAELGAIRGSQASEDFNGAQMRSKSVTDQAVVLVAEFKAAMQKIKCT